MMFTFLSSFIFLPINQRYVMIWKKMWINRHFRHITKWYLKRSTLGKIWQLKTFLFFTRPKSRYTLIIDRLMTVNKARTHKKGDQVLSLAFTLLSSLTNKGPLAKVLEEISDTEILNRLSYLVKKSLFSLNDRSNTGCS